jgi:hypothetical protein
MAGVSDSSTGTKRHPANRVILVGGHLGGRFPELVPGAELLANHWRHACHKHRSVSVRALDRLKRVGASRCRRHQLIARA